MSKSTGISDTVWMTAALNSLKDPFLFVDTHHIIRYMNRAAQSHYREGHNLIGRSLLDCHNEASCRVILEIFKIFQESTEEERLISENQKGCIYMRAVRDERGRLLGYYERYEWSSRKE